MSTSILAGIHANKNSYLDFLLQRAIKTPFGVQAIRSWINSKCGTLMMCAYTQIHLIWAEKKALGMELLPPTYTSRMHCLSAKQKCVFLASGSLKSFDT